MSANNETTAPENLPAVSFKVGKNSKDLEALQAFLDGQVIHQPELCEALQNGTATITVSEKTASHPKFNSNLAQFLIRWHEKKDNITLEPGVLEILQNRFSQQARETRAVTEPVAKQPKPKPAAKSKKKTTHKPSYIEPTTLGDLTAFEILKEQMNHPDNLRAQAFELFESIYKSNVNLSEVNQIHATALLNEIGEKMGEPPVTEYDSPYENALKRVGLTFSSKHSASEEHLQTRDDRAVAKDTINLLTEAKGLIDAQAKAQSNAAALDKTHLVRA